MLERLTSEPIFFPKLDLKADLYKTKYADGRLAIIVGMNGQVGKLSINLAGVSLGPGEFCVKHTGTGEYLNGPCWLTGLFKKVTTPFVPNGSHASYVCEVWRLKTKKEEQE